MNNTNFYLFSRIFFSTIISFSIFLHAAEENPVPLVCVPSEQGIPTKAVPVPTLCEYLVDDLFGFLKVLPEEISGIDPLASNNEERTHIAIVINAIYRSAIQKKAKKAYRAIRTQNKVGLTTTEEAETDLKRLASDIKVATTCIKAIAQQKIEDMQTKEGRQHDNDGSKSQNRSRFGKRRKAWHKKKIES